MTWRNGLLVLMVIVISMHTLKIEQLQNDIAEIKSHLTKTWLDAHE